MYPRATPPWITLCWSTASGEDLKLKKPRVMAVLDPVKLVIDNYPEGQIEMLEAPTTWKMRNWEAVRFLSGELYIERDDFMEEPPKKYFRLFPRQ